MAIYTSVWGFQRCSFRQAGQCESLYDVERASGLAPRLFCPYVITLLNNRTLEPMAQWTVFGSIIKQLRTFYIATMNRVGGKQQLSSFCFPEDERQSKLIKLETVGIRNSLLVIRYSKFELRHSPFIIRNSNLALRHSNFELRTSNLET